MFEIRPLSKSNFDDFISLLNRRGDAPSDYYFWKYLMQPYLFFPSGFIGYIDGIPSGCIGVVNMLFIDESGLEQPTTWFADWYVLESARGSGLGLKLISVVLSLSKFGFGIPGPLKAQNIAESAGYNRCDNYYEFIMPCKPINFGFLRYQEHISKRILRALYYSIKYPFIDPIGFQVIYDNKLIISEVERSCTKPNSFQIRSPFINWLLGMPNAPKKDRRYFIVKHNDNNLILILSELDGRNLRRARILFSTLELANKKNKNFLQGLTCFLKKEGIHYIQFYSYLQPGQYMDFFEVKKIPQFTTLENCCFRVEFASVESRWRDFNLMG